ncbi:hypothetical protein [Novosphingobium sp. KN65.2]|uniref:hypothetical protein n=1 Tax=Novosphingobium sp. KN65.2 TaxID=1478134 RepID=UPI0005E33BAB|nr:hypothetical protein [Novosphingobium sp. KN65.2]CDO38614.1 hypothetical protein SPHV1_640020 [Novosphingobium sp. KN65.2]
MLTIFRIIDTQTPLASEPEYIPAHQLATIANMLIDNGLIADLDDGEIEGTACNFEFNPSCFSLAQFATIFAGNDAALNVVEEAQYHGRSVRISDHDDAGRTMISVSQHLAVSPDLAMSRERAKRVHDCLGINNRVTRSLPLIEIQHRLAKPMVIELFKEHDLLTTYEFLLRMCSIDCGNATPMLAWG